MAGSIQMAFSGTVGIFTPQRIALCVVVIVMVMAVKLLAFWTLALPCMSPELQKRTVAQCGVSFSKYLCIAIVIVFFG